MIGHLAKMRTQLESTIQYYLPLDSQEVHLNPYLGKPISFRFTGHIHCSACGKATKKSYSQGHCFVCMRKLARCDMCMLKPETCHHAQGSCREPEWAEQYCMDDHYVYLANTSGLKVGITQNSQLPTRWIDQGASQALPIIRVKNRLLSGLVEIELAKYVADKTNWRSMLKGLGEPLDLPHLANDLLATIAPKIQDLQLQFGEEAIEVLIDPTLLSLPYPLLQYPSKVSSLNLDKKPLVSGVLQGIKGQYLILDTGVINIRKFASYEIEWLA